MPVLTVDNVKKDYGTTSGVESVALAGVSFEVEAGEFVGIMGPSGAGKSTLLNVIATIDTVTSGAITIGGQDICGMREPALSDFRRNKLGFVFQDYNLLDTLTLQENIALPLVLAGLKAHQIDEKVDDVAGILGISELLPKYPCEVSGGQRQRAAAARAIAGNPELVLADEPTGALDSKSAGDLMRCLQGLNEERRTTILLVTHDAFAASFCQRILFIKDGLLYREIQRDSTKRQFYDTIVSTFSRLGGDDSELR